jgi:hypothetical protein
VRYRGGVRRPEQSPEPWGPVHPDIMRSPNSLICRPQCTSALWLCIIAPSALAAYCGELQYAAFEREILGERTRAGLAHARQNGKRLGRPATAALHAAEIRKLHRAGVSKSEIARRVQIGRTSVRRILGEKS